MDILQLSNQLDSLSAWRKRELIQAYFLTENAHNDESKRFLCRAWVLMMYAHCDNFLKESAKLYIAYCKANSTENCKLELVWLALRGKENITFGSAEEYRSFDNYSATDRWALINNALMNEIFKKRSFQYKSLRFVCDWVLQIHYDHESLSDFCERLKAKRDSIAHGEESYVEDVSDCLHWHRETIRFIDELKDALVDAASRP